MVAHAEKPKPARPADLPAYTYAEAASYLGVPRSTIHSWMEGRPHFSRVVEPAAKGVASFTNLVELHVLAALRTQHVRMPHIRKAIKQLRQDLKSRHPLADAQFFTHGKRLFVDFLGSLAEIGDDAQVVIRDVLEGFLQRVERDAHGVPIRLYPAIPNNTAKRPVVIDPRVSFGRPLLAGTGTPTVEILERFLAGDEPEFIAEDLGARLQDVHDALRFEQHKAA